MRKAEAELPRVLADPNPMPGIIELYKEFLIPNVDICMHAGAWPWTPFADGTDDEVESKLTELCRRYESQWQLVDQNGIIATLPAGGQNE